MALGPQKQKKEELLRQVEAIIDKQIKGSGGDDMTIEISMLPDRFSAEDWPILEMRYKKAGWKVAEYVSDQREGDYLNFEA